MKPRTRLRIRWADTICYALTCAAALALVAAFMERIPA